MSTKPVDAGTVSVQSVRQLPPNGLAVDMVALAGTVVVKAGPVVAPKTDPAMEVVGAAEPKRPPPKALVVAAPNSGPVVASPPAAVVAKLKGFCAAAVLPNRPPDRGK